MLAAWQHLIVSARRFTVMVHQCSDFRIPEGIYTVTAREYQADLLEH